MRRITIFSLMMVLLAAESFQTKADEQATAIPPMDVPVMQEEAANAGIKHYYAGPWEYFVGGGVAAFDCNGDRLPDLALAGGTEEAQLFVNESKTGGALKFNKKAEAFPASAKRKVTGLYPLDIDNDGIRDLVLLRVGKNIILKGQGDCRFEKANRIFSFKGGRAWTTAFSAIFEKDQAFPTLAFGNYVDRSAPGSPWGTCHDNYQYRPADSKKRLDYSDPQTLSPGYCALSMLYTDWNRSGSPDLRITNDRQYYRGGQEQLWRIAPGRSATPYRKMHGWQPLRIWGMGIAEADLNADGFPEYALTSMGDTKLQMLDDEADEGRPLYRDIAYERGATAHRPYTGNEMKPSTGWHAEFADFNNDGRLDLYIAKGNVEQMPDFAAFDPDNLLLGDANSKFVETGALSGIALKRSGRGAAIADLNMDGKLDLVVVNRKAPVSLFRNLGAKADFGPRAMGNWLQIELRQKNINRDAVGAKIVVKSGNDTRIRKVQIGGGHASGRLGFTHVGLGPAERAEIRVQWPDGEWSAPYRVFANQFMMIEKGAADILYWHPHK